MKKMFSIQLIFALMTLPFCCLVVSSCDKNADNRTRNNDTVKITRDIKYGSNKNWKSNIENLLLDIYTPPGALPSQKFPLIVYVHGGGFQDGNKEENKTLMIDFASEQFVAVSMDYRLGWTQADSCIGDTTEAKKAIYRAVQDARAAIRFLVANAEKYNIDTAKIFLSGESAGAITVLSSSYFTQLFADHFLPGAALDLGLLDDADNSLKNKFSIKGIGSVAGCLSDAHLINAGNARPTIYMHGVLDNVIPYNTGTAYNCPNYFNCFGSYFLYNASKTLVPTVLHLDSAGTHNVYDESFIKVNQVCFFKSIIANTEHGGYYTGETSSCH